MISPELGHVPEAVGKLKQAHRKLFALVARASTTQCRHILR